MGPSKIAHMQVLGTETPNDGCHVVPSVRTRPPRTVILRVLPEGRTNEMGDVEESSGGPAITATSFGGKNTNRHDCCGMKLNRFHISKGCNTGFKGNGISDSF